MTIDASTTDKWSRLVLVGFMGAGKSTVGGRLAARLNLPFLDSDAVIEQQSGRTVPELFHERGEAEFRLLESRVIVDLLTRSRVVIALGGGALESAATRLLLHESIGTTVLHLEASLSTMLERCREVEAASGSVRPLLQDQPSLVQRHDRRLQHYRAAHLTVVTDNLDPDAVVEHVLQALRADSNSGSLPADSLRTEPLLEEGAAH